MPSKWTKFGTTPCFVLALMSLNAISMVGQKDAAPEPAPAGPPRFAVSSIKLSRPDAQLQDFRVVVSGANVQSLNGTLGELLVLLVRSRHMEGGPAWVRERRFDIRANSEDGTSPTNPVLTQMTLQLLRDRFKLAYHIESREVAGLALTVGKKQPNMVPSKDGEQRGVTWGSSVVFKKFAMLDFSNALSDSLDTPIVDRTDLKGEFDITLPMDDYRSANGDVPFAERLRSSVEGLGFRFVSEKVQVNYVIVDHAELPDGN